MVVSDFATQMLPKTFDQIKPGRIGRQHEEQKLIRILFKELLGFAAAMNDEVIDH